MQKRGRGCIAKVLTVLAAAYLALSTSSFAMEGHFERTLPVTGPVELNIRSGAGNLTLHAGGDASVHVYATIRSRGWLFSGEDAEKRVRYLEDHFPIEQHGNTITIGAITDPSLLHNISISYELTVPAATRLKAKTGSGDQAVDGIDGPVGLSSGSGDVKALNIGGSVQVSTGSGDVELDSVKGSIRASTGSGDIRARRIAGSFRASTGSGDVTVEQTAVADARVSTASGRVVLKHVRGLVHTTTASGSILAEGGGREPWHLQTASGDVTVRVPPALGFDLQAHTVSGSITTARALTLQGSVGPHKITGRAGNGGFLLDVSTVSGDIQIDWMAPSSD